MNLNQMEATRAQGARAYRASVHHINAGLVRALAAVGTLGRGVCAHVPRHSNQEEAEEGNEFRRENFHKWAGVLEHL